MNEYQGFGDDVIVVGSGAGGSIAQDGHTNLSYNSRQLSVSLIKAN